MRLPPRPIDVARDVKVENKRQHNQAPPRLHPKQEQQIERGPESKGYPFFS